MSDDKSAAIVIELAKVFIELVQQIEPGWRKGYFRFRSEGSWYGSNASYEVGTEVLLVSSFKYKDFFLSMNEKAVNLLEALQKEKAVLLLVIDINYNYEIKFEYQNLDRWTITRMNGGTGVPEGIAE